MTFYEDLKTFYLKHGQKTMALLGATLSTLSLADPTIIPDFLGPKGSSYLTLAASLVVGWRAVLAK